MIDNKEKNFLSVVIYLNNMQQHITGFLEKITAEIDSHFQQTEYIFVDDGCRDGSILKIKEFFAERNNENVVSIIHMSKYQGLESSMSAGVNFAIGDYILEIDSVYMDYETSLLFEVYQKVLQGNDIVAATPKGKIGFFSKVFYLIYNRSAKNNSYLMQREAFRILSRRALNRIQNLNIMIPYRKATYINCGLKYESVSYDNEFHKVKDVSDYRLNTAIDTLILFTDSVLSIALFLGVLFLVFTLGIGVYAIASYWTENPLEGWTTTILFLSASFCGVFFLFTICIKYLSIILNMVFDKHNYLIESIEKL